MKLAVTVRLKRKISVAVAVKKKLSVAVAFKRIEINNTPVITFGHGNPTYP